VYNIISKIQEYKRFAHNFHPVPVIRTLLVGSSDEEQLYQLSLSREPRGADRKDIL
jgi:hypothetical protein